MADLYPESLTPDEAKLVSTMKTAYKEIVKEINTATSFGVANRKAILNQINGILANLQVDIADFIKKEIPDYYKAGAQDAIDQLTHLGAEIRVAEGFNQVHKEAIQALVSDTAKSFGEAIRGVGRSATLLLNKATKQQITQKMATGMTQGAALTEVRQNIKGILQEQGLDSLVDKGGKSWTLDRYSEMLYRTKMVEARNTGLVNRMVQNGYDLAQVSMHGASDVCRNWEGKIISINGETEGYPTLADAEIDGLFHPNCRHAINALTPDLADQTYAWNAETQQYEPGGGLPKDEQ